ncbi:MAG: RNA polymerase sigma factor [Gemmatimonadales bacterium]|nr:MAG: RNA polymerase sigma factor [Gemmatimonadales bacterium]
MNVTLTSRFPEDDDRILVAGARDGDADALAELVQRHQGVLFRFLLARTGDEDQAADLAQDALVKALRSLPQFRGDSSFRTWLLAIARNEMLGRHRKEGRRKEQGLETGMEVADDRPAPGQALETQGEVDRVRRLMDRLPEKQRLSVWLRLYDGLSFREVAEATDSTEGAARVNYFHGIRKLREWADESRT